MSSDPKIVFKVEFKRGRSGRKRATANPRPRRELPVGKLPRVTRLMALAIRFEGLIRDGEVHDYAEIARSGYVTRARVTQIMNLLLLAPDIQQEILFLPRAQEGRDPITERDLRPIAAMADWGKQRKAWRRLAQVGRV